MSQAPTKLVTSERVGLFGGTFNPIHYGHLRAAEEIREFFHLSRVFFVPARIPPHKNGTTITSPSHRLRMVQLAIEDNAFFAASDFEVKQKRTSYSIYTIEHFRETVGPHTELFFLMGIDSFREIITWKDYVRLFSLINLVVMSRPRFSRPDPSHILPVDVAKDFDYNRDHHFFRHPSGHRLYFHEITLLEISSSAIRRQIRQGQSVRYLIPPAVEDYTTKHGLFRK